MYGMEKKQANFLPIISHVHVTFYIFTPSNIQTHLILTNDTSG